MALFSSPPAPTHNLPTLSPHPSSRTHPTLTHKSHLFLLVSKPRRSHFFCISTKAESDNGTGVLTPSAAAAVTEEKPVESSPAEAGSTASAVADGVVELEVKNFEDARWANGTWDLKQFEKDGKTNWDAVIDAEARRRKWLENNPETSSNNDPIVFDTSIIPWWAWVKKFHLPEAELLNGRAAMIGFFMAYLVDSLTGLGVVDQMSNFVCKTLLFVAVLGVLLVRKNEDIGSLKKLLEETTFYDKQWQATWQDDPKK
ncbi:hypothetical protein Dimus_030520 [Dionaea muscipula]